MVVHACCASERVKRTRSSSQLAAPCQNMIRNGSRVYPPLKGVYYANLFELINYYYLLIITNLFDLINYYLFIIIIIKIYLSKLTCTSTGRKKDERVLGASIEGLHGVRNKRIGFKV